MPLNAQLTLSILAHETSSGDLSRTLRATPVSYALSLADGTGANQAQVVWSDSRTFTGTDTLTPSSLADTRDGAAVTVNISQIKAFYVRNTGASAFLTISAPLIGFGGSTIRTEVISVPPGGAVMLASPSDTGNLSGMAGATTTYTFSSSATGQTYDIVLIGEGTVT